MLVDRLSSPDHDQVGVENGVATLALVDHLLGLGHERIAFVSGKRGLTTTNERLDGYSAAMRAAGLRVNEDLFVVGNSASEPARLATHKLLSGSPRPTAVIGGNNLMTLGVMRAVQEAGLRVPDDIALVSFDDFEWADLFSPRLTTMAQPCFEIGRRAIELLIARIADPGRPPETVRLHAELRVRESCGTVRPITR